MKKFNFVKVFALMAAAVFGLVFAGCEDLSGAVNNAFNNGEVKKAEASGAEGLKDAFTDPSVEVVEIKDNIKADELELSIPAGDKTISIPGGKETSIGSLALSAGSHVKIVNADDGTAKSVSGALAAEYSGQSYDGWATLVIWNNFVIPDGATFDLIGRTRLIFRTAVVDGKLAAEIEDSILGAGEEKPKITGGGKIGEQDAAQAADGIKNSEAHKEPPEPDYDLEEEDDPIIDDPGLDKLAAIKFADTKNKSSGGGFTILDSEDDKGATAEWTLSTVEKANVYFAVTKTAEQTVTVSGTNDDAVTVAQEAGEEIDGSQPGDTLAVVTVDASDFDTQFDGGKYEFTLTVSEQSETVKTVNVTLNSGIDTEIGVTIFKVTYAGEKEKLEKLDAKIGVQTNKTAATDKNTWQNNPQPVGSLYDANRWLEHAAESGTESTPAEYLIRLNKDADGTLPIGIILSNRNYVTVWLRGVNANIKIPPPYATFTESNANVFNTRSNMSGGLIRVGHENTGNHLTLKLESVILDGCEGRSKIYFDTGKPLYNLITLGKEVTVIMKKDSKLTGFDGKAGVSGVTVVDVKSNGSQFLMYEGSEITGNKFSTNVSDDTKTGWILVYNKAMDKFTFRRPQDVETIHDNISTLSATYLKKVHCTADTGGGDLYDSFFD